MESARGLVASATDGGSRLPDPFAVLTVVGSGACQSGSVQASSVVSATTSSTLYLFAACAKAEIGGPRFATEFLPSSTALKEF